MRVRGDLVLEEHLVVGPVASAAEAREAGEEIAAGEVAEEIAEAECLAAILRTIVTI